MDLARGDGELGQLPADGPQEEGFQAGTVRLFKERKCTLLDLCDMIDLLQRNIDRFTEIVSRDMDLNNKDHAQQHFQLKEIEGKLDKLYNQGWILMRRGDDEEEEEKEVVFEVEEEPLKKQKRKKKTPPPRERFSKRLASRPPRKFS